MEDLTLVIMAAGMGSRFGGLKQIEPFGPNNEFLIDYSVYDAIMAGFNKVVFIIKKENLDIFKETIGKRIEDKIKVEYVFQRLDIEDVPKTRVKPFGTAHAILACKDVVNTNFLVINSDDFYGYESFALASKFLRKNKGHNYCNICFEVSKTMSLNGSVKRGIVEEKNGYLTMLDESSVVREGNDIIATSLVTNKVRKIEDNTLVSCNMLGFTPSIFGYLEKELTKFLKENKDNLDTCEFLIPTVLETAIKDKYAKCRVIKTPATWQGVTYLSDKEDVLNYLNKLIKEGKYPSNLWG